MGNNWLWAGVDLGVETASVCIINSAGDILHEGVCPGFTESDMVAEAIANSQAFSNAGGGDTLAAIARYGVGGRISYISTGGGAFLEFLEGKELPAVAALKTRG